MLLIISTLSPLGLSFPLLPFLSPLATPPSTESVVATRVIQVVLFINQASPPVHESNSPLSLGPLGEDGDPAVAGEPVRGVPVFVMVG